MSRTANVCMISGKLASETRTTVNVETGLDQTDFMVEVVNEGVDAKRYINRVLCRVVGDKAYEVKDLAIGSKIALVGKLKYSNFRGYVEAREIDIFSAN